MLESNFTENEVREFIVEGKTVQVSEDNNQCDRCWSIQLSDTEMYWQDTMGDGIYYKHIEPFDAVCDKCFHELKGGSDE